MKTYDIVMFLSCEGAQYRARPSLKAAMDAVKVRLRRPTAAALFASHWHNVWIEGADGTDDQFQKPDGHGPSTDTDVDVASSTW